MSKRINRLARLCYPTSSIVAASWAIHRSECRANDDAELAGTVFGHPALKHGFPQTNYTAASESFVACYDFRTRNPAWVVERLTNASVRLDEAKREREKFREAPPVIPERLRSKLVDFAGSGYDRGHLAPAANHKQSQRAMHDTFSLVNISPQVGEGFNRDFWARIEKFVRDVATSGMCDEVIVATGPLFLPSSAKTLRADHATIGSPPSLVHVPTHFYKIILTDTRPRTAWSGAGYSVGAFVVPNRPIDPETPLTDFIAPLDAVEAAAGVLFFAKLLNQDRRAALNTAEARHLSSNRRRHNSLLTANTKHAAATQAQSSDITHLCDRVRCELVTARLFDKFKHQRGPQSHSRHDSKMILEESDRFD